MLRKQILRTVLVGIGLGSLAAVVYFVGPFIAFGEWRPLENPIVRNVVILLLVAGVAAVAGMEFHRRRKGAQQIAEGISGAGETVNDEPVLKERMSDALATLKTASGNKSGYLYDLPWYIIIGPPGAGKTTALVNSGLKFPLARGATPVVFPAVDGIHQSGAPCFPSEPGALWNHRKCASQASSGATYVSPPLLCFCF